MSESEVLSDENSTSSDVENDILEDLKPYQFEPEKEAITSVADTDKKEEECSEESDEDCHSHCHKRACQKYYLVQMLLTLSSLSTFFNS